MDSCVLSELVLGVLDPQLLKQGGRESLEQVVTALSPKLFIKQMMESTSEETKGKW